MRLYKVHFMEDSGTSEGFEYFASQVKAKKEAATYRAGEGNDLSTTIEVITVAPSKQGILDALNSHASHAENG
jgi:hypothetical protein